ncbi:TPA: hypothetical protein JAN03_11750 [Citrobacter freundii]|nr:hypothetical protein [Citrobacter freundii]
MCIYFLSSDNFFLRGLCDTIELTNMGKALSLHSIVEYEALADQISDIESKCRKDDIVIFDFDNVDFINLCSISALKCKYKTLFVIDHPIKNGFFFYNQVCFLSKKSSFSLISFLIMKITLFNEYTPAPLTIREHMILSLMSQGVGQRKIAKLLNVSNQSVSRYKRVIEFKTGVGNCNSFLFMKYSRVLTQLNHASVR